MYNVGIYRSWQEMQQTSANSLQGMQPVQLCRTDEPVSPEAEAAEAAALRSQGLPVPILAEPAEGEDILRQVEIELPDRLLAPVPAEGTQQFDDAHWSYFGFTVPTSYQGPEQFSLHSLKLTLDLATTEQVTGTSQRQEAPVAMLLHPLSEGAQTAHDYGEVGVDLGQLAACFAPVIARALKMDVHLDLRTSTYDPKVQTSGIQKRHCEWTVTDPGAARGFNPAVVAQSPAGEQLRVTAHLHIEVRKRTLGIIKKTYAKSAIPFCYVHNPTTQVFDGFELDSAQGTSFPLEGAFIGTLKTDIHIPEPSQPSVAAAIASMMLESVGQPSGRVPINRPDVAPTSQLDAPADEQGYQSALASGKIPGEAVDDKNQSGEADTETESPPAEAST